VHQPKERVSLVKKGRRMTVIVPGMLLVRLCGARYDHRRFGEIQMGDIVSACTQQVGGSHCLGVARMTEKASSEAMRRRAGKEPRLSAVRRKRGRSAPLFVLTLT
jgi:hypothetical protein